MDEDLFARINDAQNRARVLGEFNAATHVHVGPIGSQELGMRVLRWTNSTIPRSVDASEIVSQNQRRTKLPPSTC